MKITKQQLIELDACEEGLARFVKQTNNTDRPVDVASLFGGKNTVDDLLWLACECGLIDNKLLSRFSKDCALTIIELVKPYCSEEQYKVIIDYLNNDELGCDNVSNVSISVSQNTLNDSNYIAHSVIRSVYHSSRLYYYAAAKASCYVTKESKGKVEQLMLEMFNKVE